MYNVSEQTIEFESPLRGVYLRDVLRSKSQAMREALDNEVRKVLQQKEDEDAYITSVLNRFSITIPQLDFDSEHLKKNEDYKDVSASQYAHEIFFSRNDQVRVWVITFGIPYSGDIELIKYVPSGGAELQTYEFTARDQHLWFSVQTRDTANKDIAAIRAERDQKVNVLRQRLQSIIPELETYNQGLAREVPELFARLKQKFQDDKKTLDQL
jgi:hypothetical protein